MYRVYLEKCVYVRVREEELNSIPLTTKRGGMRLIRIYWADYKYIVAKHLSQNST